MMLLRRILRRPFATPVSTMMLILVVACGVGMGVLQHSVANTKSLPAPMSQLTAPVVGGAIGASLALLTQRARKLSTIAALPSAATREAHAASQVATGIPQIHAAEAAFLATACALVLWLLTLLANTIASISIRPVEHRLFFLQHRVSPAP
jgi:hypothetical protein